MFVTTGMPTNPYVINIVEDARALGVCPPHPDPPVALALGLTQQHASHLSRRDGTRAFPCSCRSWRSLITSVWMPSHPTPRHPTPAPACPGLGHIFVLVWDEAKCGELPGPYREAISCAWDSRRSQESANAFNDLLAKRW